MINLLITGGAGFIGSNFTRFWIKNNPKDNVFVLDKLSYAGNKKSLEDLLNEKSNLTFIKGDICNYELLISFLEKYNITHIVHLAAESHVDRSITSPKNFIDTNINGTFFLLEAFRNYWYKKNKPSNYRFLHVSTDEVFGSLNDEDASFNESFPYNPRSPYSASKASSDHLVNAWIETYKLPINISNCSNNFGPYQFPEKLIPKAIIKILKGEKIPIYGKGENIRDWLYVEDHCRALELIIKSEFIGEKFCIGASNEIKNIDLIKLVCKEIDNLSISNLRKPSSELIEFVKDRKGHDYRYSIDSSKIKNLLNWESKISLKEGISKTIKWYLDEFEWWEQLSED